MQEDYRLEALKAAARIYAGRASDGSYVHPDDVTTMANQFYNWLNRA